MNDDGMQGMLFGSVTDDRPEPPERPDELCLCALNVSNPSPPRAQNLLDWLIGTRCNALVLTELRPGDGSRLLINALAAHGYEPHLPPGWTDSKHFSLIASRDLDYQVVTEPFDPRAVAVDLRVSDWEVRLVGLYGPTNGMMAESSDRRRAFQQEFLEFLGAVKRPSLVLAGDLNVVEPGHTPHLESFQEHDYDFYRDLLALGLVDAFRALHPTDPGHSWLSDRYGAQRLDHILTSRTAGALMTCGYDHTPRIARLTDHAALLATLGRPGTP